MSTSELDRGPAHPAAAIGEVEVRRSERRHKTVSARLVEGKLIISIPARMSAGQEEHWVREMTRRFERRERRRRLNTGGGLQRRAQELNRQYFDGRLKWESVEYVTNQSSRFGSCSPDAGKIRLSSSLAAMPVWVRDYVLVHELAHLLVPNHSQRFWDLVNRYPLTERARGYLLAKGADEDEFA